MDATASRTALVMALGGPVARFTDRMRVRARAAPASCPWCQLPKN
jgi:hypothetical protein